MSDEPDSFMFRYLREMRAEMLAMRAEAATTAADLRSEMHSLRADVASDILTLRTDVAADMKALRRDLTDQIVGLRRAVMEYHSSVIGHASIISDLEARPRRVEQRLDLPAPDVH